LYQLKRYKAIGLMNKFQTNANLRLLYGCGVSVTHRTDVEVLLAFQVTLTKELLHDAVSPSSVQVERLRRVAEVRAVHQTLQHLQPLQLQTYSYSYTLPRTASPSDYEFQSALLTYLLT